MDQYLEEYGITADVKTYPDYEDLFDAFDSHEIDILAAVSDGQHLPYRREHAVLVFYVDHRAGYLRYPPGTVHFFGI